VVGPDIGIKINKRIGRFIKSYLRFLNWKDNYFFLQAQAYWIINNIHLYKIKQEIIYKNVAIKAADYIIDNQKSDGSWEYPLKERKNLVATIEGCWASIALIKVYNITKNTKYLESSKKWHAYLEKNIGYEKYGESLCVNYFQKPRGLIPNNTTLLIWLNAELYNSTHNKKYIKNNPAMIRFLEKVQLPSGELPYCIGNTYEKTKIHYLCYQYNSFELIDLRNYYELTKDKTILKIINKLEKYILNGITKNYRSKNSCNKKNPSVNYYDAILGLALINNRSNISKRIYEGILNRQKTNGGFSFSEKNYFILHDKREYPRALNYILYSLINACENINLFNKKDVLVTCKLDDNVVVSHLTPLSNVDNINTITIIRDKEGKPIPKSRYIVSKSKIGVLKSIEKLFNIIKFGKNADIIWAFYLIPHGINAIVAGKIIKKPVGVSIIGTDLNVHLESWYGKMLAKILNFADIITVTGTRSKKILINKGINSSKIQILPNAIDTDRFKPLNLKKIYDLIFVGRLVPVKNVDKIIRLTAEMKKFKKNIKLAIAGDGPERQQLEKLTTELGLKSNVIFLGYQQKVEYFLNQSRFFIMASSSEGLPIALIEAMACGTIPIVPDVGDISDIVTDKKIIIYKDINKLDTNKIILTPKYKTKINFDIRNYSKKETQNFWKKEIKKL